jgi:hypothetical protein
MLAAATVKPLLRTMRRVAIPRFVGMVIELFPWAFHRRRVDAAGNRTVGHRGARGTSRHWRTGTVFYALPRRQIEDLRGLLDVRTPLAGRG